ncbi:uncharacterized protein LOC129607351 [Condylostylus longicornis]|uniref:uncharacterized protein LOC129607351 n=1 Tax=Condylostylus longicornis TaxID=2530218 RepID=UPI00244DDDF7|nr:uncharacterized protein LOC129607351 [Condylostylus longicornis]
MAKPLLNSFCWCGSLRFGSILSGFLAIILSIISIVLIFTTRIEFKTIVLDWLPPSVVKIILAINLVMTIIISTLMIVGVFKRNHFCMVPWVALGIMICVGLLVSVIYTAIVYFIDGLTIVGILWLVIGLISVALFTYSWCVVYSLYTIMSEENQRGIYNKSPYRR